MGCDVIFSIYTNKIQISIHAPTWGATPADIAAFVFPYISIHAPTWGATHLPVSANMQPLFQSTHPRGVRRNRSNRSHTARYFNPRTHVGCDDVCALLAERFIRFQSTHPRGVRRVERAKIGLKMHFNPRTHVGCDRLRSCP